MRMISLAMAVLVIGATPLAAQSAEEQVEQAVLDFYQHLADKDAAGWSAMVHEGGTNFPRTGAVLGVNNLNAQGMQGAFDSGALSYQLAIHNLDVDVYGDAAVATFYTTGPSLINGQNVTGTFRVTQVWVREGNGWRAAHWHISPLER